MAGTEGGGGMAREEYRDGAAAAVLRWRGWDSTFIPRCRLLTYCYARFTKEVEYRTVVYRTLTVDFGESNSTAPMMLLVYLMTQAASSHRSEPGALRWRQSDAHCELLQVGCRLLLTLLTTHGPNPDAHS